MLSKRIEKSHPIGLATTKKIQISVLLFHLEQDMLNQSSYAKKISISEN